MKVAHPVADKLLVAIKARRGDPVAVSDLMKHGSPAAVKQSLSRLARAGTIRRVGRGLYAWPRYSQLFHELVDPPVHKLVQAWARDNNLKVIPFAAHAANMLGVSTQVPAKYIYYTNGRTRQVILGGSKVQMLNRGPRTMDVKGDRAPLLFQALKYLGRHGITPSIVAKLRGMLRPRDRKDILDSLPLAPAWMRPFLLSITGEEPS